MNSLIRFSPAADIRRLQSEMDRLFGGFFPKFDDAAETEASVWTPRVDLAETKDAYVVELDVPGMSKEELSISVHEGALTISGDRKTEQKTEDTDYVRVERRFGHFYRSFSLPKSIVANKIDAKYVDGVLTIRIPKAEEGKPKRIDIK